MLQVSEGDRTWAYPLAWRKPELLALQGLARNRINRLDLSLASAEDEANEVPLFDKRGKRKPQRIYEGTSRQGWELEELIESLYPAVLRLASLAEEVAA